MELASQTYRYSPLGWAIWLYGPAFALGGVALLGIWVTSLLHRLANNDHLWCASRCLAIDYFFDGILIIGFPLFALILLAIGLLMMNSDRTTTVSSSSLTTSRGSFIHWDRQTFAASDIAGITIDSVPITMVFGDRSTTSGFRYTVNAEIGSATAKKHKRIIIGLFSSEPTAQHVQSVLKNLLR